MKKMFKVISAIEKRGGGTYWMRVGSAFINKDESINVYLDAVPKTMTLQLRELDAEELAKRDSFSKSDSFKSDSFKSDSFGKSDSYKSESFGRGAPPLGKSQLDLDPNNVPF